MSEDEQAPAERPDGLMARLYEVEQRLGQGTLSAVVFLLAFALFLLFGPLI